MWTYGIHSLPLTIKDLVGDTRSMFHRFVACDFEGLDANLILGYPWLVDVDPTIGYPRGGGSTQLERPRLMWLMQTSSMRNQKALKSMAYGIRP